MPAKPPRKSSSFVKVKFLDAPEIIRKLKLVSRDLLEKNKNVLCVYLFGSLAKGTYAPGSDADILIVLKKDDRRIMDRIPEFLRFFLGSFISTDIFPYTQDELKEMLSNGNPFITAVWEKKTTLAER